MDNIDKKKGERYAVNYRGTPYPGFNSSKEAEDFIDSKPGWREGGAVAIPLIGKQSKKTNLVAGKDRSGLTNEIERLTKRIERRTAGAKRIRSGKLKHVLPPIEAVSELRKAATDLLELFFSVNEYQDWQKIKSGNE